MSTDRHPRSWTELKHDSEINNPSVNRLSTAVILAASSCISLQRRGYKLLGADVNAANMKKYCPRKVCIPVRMLVFRYDTTLLTYGVCHFITK